MPQAIWFDRREIDERAKRTTFDRRTRGASATKTKQHFSSASHRNQIAVGVAADAVFGTNISRLGARGPAIHQSLLNRTVRLVGDENEPVKGSHVGRRNNSARRRPPGRSHACMGHASGWSRTQPETTRDTSRRSHNDVVERHLLVGSHCALALCVRSFEQQQQQQQQKRSNAFKHDGHHFAFVRRCDTLCSSDAPRGRRDAAQRLRSTWCACAQDKHTQASRNCRRCLCFVVVL